MNLAEPHLSNTSPTCAWMPRWTRETETWTENETGTHPDGVTGATAMMIDATGSE